MSHARVLVTAEPSGTMHLPARLVLVDPAVPTWQRIIALPTSSPYKGGFARGGCQGDDGALYLAGEHRILVLDPEDFSLMRVLVSPRFADLHSIAWHTGALLAVNTFYNEVLRVDPLTGQHETWFAADTDENHFNTLTEAETGWLLTAHGERSKGAVWRVGAGAGAPLWTHAQTGQRLLHPHDGTALSDGVLAVNESGRGRLVYSTGESVFLGGWCRGMLPWEGGLLCGVNPFHDPRPDARVFSPQLVLVRDGRIVWRLPLGLGRPHQTYALLPWR